VFFYKRKIALQAKGQGGLFESLLTVKLIILYYYVKKKYKKMILQKIMHNRIFFLACLGGIWTLTFLIPHIGNFVKTKRYANLFFNK